MSEVVVSGVVKSVQLSIATVQLGTGRVVQCAVGKRAGESIDYVNPGDRVSVSLSADGSAQVVEVTHEREHYSATPEGPFVTRSSEALAVGPRRR